MRCLILSVFLFCFLHAQATSGIDTFVATWYRYMAYDENLNGKLGNPNCDSISTLYSDHFTWYGLQCACDTFFSFLSHEENFFPLLASSSFTIDSSDARHQKYRINLDVIGIFGGFKEHYMIVENSKEGFRITSHSSVADDQWKIRKAEIASQQVYDKKGKRYYVLDRLDSLLGTQVVLLTDTLTFYEPQYIDVCNAIEIMGYSTSGRVFIATCALGPPTTVHHVKEITQELNDSAYNKYTLIRGGIPVLIPSMAYVYHVDDYAQAWQTPFADLEYVNSKLFVLKYTVCYESGDRCVDAEVMINYNPKREKFVVRKIIKDDFISGE